MSHDDSTLLFDSAELLTGSHGRGLISGGWHTPSSTTLHYSGISYLAGDVRPGHLFVQPSPHSWGEGYERERESLAQLQRRGATTVLLDQPPAAVPDGMAVALVPDTAVALAQLAQHCRQRYSGDLVCVTGSVGKSTTKAGLAALLARHQSTHSSPRNFNHYHGVLLSLAGLPRDSRHAVLEFSADRPRYTLPKAMIAAPDVTVITDIQHDHTDCYPTLEAIADQKALLCRALRPGGALVFNRDSPLHPRLMAAARAEGDVRLIGFGRSAAADVQLLDASALERGWQVSVRWLGEPLHYRLSLPAPHDLHNSLAMLAALAALQLDPVPLLPALEKLEPLPRHCATSVRPWQHGTIQLIDDSFSANPASLRSALAHLEHHSQGHGGRRLLVLGSMAELGEQSAALHRSLADLVLLHGIDRVYAHGRETAHTCAALPQERIGLHSSDSSALVEALANDLQPGDWLVLKVSRYSRLSAAIQTMLQPAATAPAAHSHPTIHR